VADQPEQPNDSADAFGAGGFSQDDIDALLTQNEASDQPSDAVAPNDEVPISAAPPDSTDFDQNDIDALINAAGDGGIAGDAAGASAGDGESESATPETEAPAAPDTRVDTLGRPFDEAAAAMQAAIDEERAEKEAQAATAPQAPAAAPLNTAALELNEFSDEAAASAQHRVTMLNDVDLNVRIQLGQTRMLVEEVLNLDSGSVVELDKLAGDPVDVFVNDRLVARGEVLVLNDNFCVRISDVLSRDPHRVIT